MTTVLARGVVKPEAVASNCDDIIVVVDLGQPVAQTTHQCVDRLFRDPDALLLGPDGVYHFVPAADGAPRVIEQLQETKLGQRERGIQLLSGDPHLTPVAVQDQTSAQRWRTWSSGTVASVPIKRNLTLKAI